MGLVTVWRTQVRSSGREPRLKRALVIGLVAMLVLVLSAGTAFASACTAAPCAAMRAQAAATAGSGCEAFTGAGTRCDGGWPAALGARCTMKPERHTSDQGAPASAPDLSVAAVSGAPMPVHAAGGPVLPATVPVDARGAPHLVSVIRI